MKNPHFSSYSDCTAYLFSLERAGIKYDLRNITTLLSRLGNPHKNFSSIHVAGTNGKGSAASIIYSYLIESGMSAGLYTSPHIEDFRERIIVNGRKISKKYVVDFTNEMRKHIEAIGPSFFEVTTAMAFKYFADKRVIAAVVETGLGGRLDSTNILNSDLSVITGISIDHVQYLGNSVKKIAGEKAGIIKKGMPVVVGKLVPEAAGVISMKAHEMNSAYIDSWKRVRGRISKRKESGFHFVFGKEEEYFMPEVGDFQLINLKTAYTALKIYLSERGMKFHSGIFRKSLLNLVSNSRLHGRFELISDNPGIVIDVAHNLEAIKNLAGNLKYIKFRKLFVLLGMMHDKDFCSCVREVGKLDCSVILTKPKYSRAADPARMIECTNNSSGKFTAVPDLKMAADLALSGMNRNDLLVVTGSFYLAGEFLRLKKIRELRKQSQG